MHARQMAAMAEATRLTRQGRLIEATALIQQTLASPAVTQRAPDAPSAKGTPLGQIHSGWLTRRRTVPSRSASSLRRPQRPAALATKRPAGRLEAFSTPTPLAPAPTGSTFPPATPAARCPWS